MPKCHLRAVQILAKSDEFGSRMLCCFHKRLLVLPYYKWMVPVPARCAGSSWKNAGWLGGLLTLSSCWIPRREGRRVEQSEKVRTPVGARPLWKTRNCRRPAASSWLLPWGNGEPTFSDVSFLEEAGNPAFYIISPDFYKFSTNGDFLEHSGSQAQQSVGQWPFCARAWLLQVWSLDQQPQHLPGTD